ncbi:MAG: acyl-CoA dehydrogenase family protein [Betaproteobacteria bacterium]|nr:acyl-CoA dehydrogenase family protein [Betaproteobacteria bacterium]MBU6513613.1 acyl-CoA dehydrogenase family protein [Betaproteobacteria bacterium]
MAWTYEAPLRHMRFVLGQVLDAPAAWAACPAHAELDLDTACAVLEQGARFAAARLQPLNACGDLVGCRLDEGGQVRTPEGFGQAYREFVEAGWPALAAEPRWGGQGLPLLLDACLREMLDACNHAWNMYPDLLHGAVETLAAHGSEELRQRYLPRLVSGEWLAAMALTEPQAGSDLGLLRTRAEPQADGSLRVRGSKIFISGGDHDLSDNIVHLVLCRLPGAAPGTRGLSLALVPKLLPDGSRNAMHCDSLEHKMGLRASATCAMRYEGATGWLIGEPGRGLAAMFVMMNSARLHVALQGLGHAEMAAQNALRHACERRQLRLPGPRGDADAEADPIVRHPAMRHALLALQAQVEAGRVMAVRAALALDLAAHHPDPAVRAARQAEAALLTPLLKAGLTRLGFEGASAALQVFGGYGYVREYGIEQSVRDARIAMIYEGTNEIQAIDLVQRKLLGDGGAALRALLREFRAEARECSGQPRLQAFARALQEPCEQAEAALDALLARDDPRAVLALAQDAMDGLWWLLCAWAFAASARAALREPVEDALWAEALLARMRYGVDWLLPRAALHWQRIRSQDLVLPEVQAAR